MNWKIILLAIVAGALIIPGRIQTASAVSRGVAHDISSSLTALGSIRAEPVFNPTFAISGNIGSRVVDRFLPGTSDDPVGEPIGGIHSPGLSKTPFPVDDPLEYEHQIPSSPFYETG